MAATHATSFSVLPRPVSPLTVLAYRSSDVVEVFRETLGYFVVKDSLPMSRKASTTRFVTSISHDLFTEIQNCDNVKIKFETLHTMDSSDTIDIDSHMSDRASVSSKNAADSDNMMMITPELLGLMPSGSSGQSDSGENNSRGHSGQSSSHHHGSKSWTQEDMDAALDALRNHDMSLTKASGNWIELCSNVLSVAICANVSDKNNIFDQITKQM